MTEKEKQRQGLLYDAVDSELCAERDSAKEILYDLNHLRPSQKAEREALLRKLFGKVGENPIIDLPFYCDYGSNITVGDHFYANHGLVILDCAPVTIGNHVMIGPQVGIYTAGHPLDAGQRIACLEYAYPITIGDNVWIGGNATIMPGVTIGSNTVIGAGSVVTRDIPSGVVAVGNPCRVIRAITEADKDKYR